MKLRSTLILLSVISVSLLSCGNTSDDSEKIEKKGRKVITVNFKYGESLSPTAYRNIYVIWIENATGTYIQNVSVCSKLVSGTLTGIVLPYWKINVFPKSADVDAVTSATKSNTDFSVSAELRDTTLRKFTIYFEIDRSYEPNDWFPDKYKDQPALLYKAEVDLDSDVSEYEMTPAGWTSNDITENIIPNTPRGILQSEMRYITHHRSGDTFGEADPLGATRMVKQITVVIQ